MTVHCNCIEFTRVFAAFTSDTSDPAVITDKNSLFSSPAHDPDGKIGRLELYHMLWANFNTFSAGYTVLRFDSGTVSGCREVLRIEQLGTAKGIAAADMAVTNSEYIMRAIPVRDLVHVSILFGTDQQLIDLLAICSLAAICLNGRGRRGRSICPRRYVPRICRASRKGARCRALLFRSESPFRPG